MCVEAGCRLEAGPELNSCCFISRHRALIQTQGHMLVLSPAVLLLHTHTYTHLHTQSHTHTRTHPYTRGQAYSGLITSEGLQAWVLKRNLDDGNPAAQEYLCWLRRVAEHVACEHHPGNIGGVYHASSVCPVRNYRVLVLNKTLIPPPPPRGHVQVWQVIMRRVCTAERACPVSVHT